MMARAFFIIVLCLLSVACANMNVKNQADKLHHSLTEYGADLRWDRKNYAYAYHVFRDGTQPEVDLENLERFSVTGFKPLNPVLNEDATEATIPVEIDYYDEQFGTLRKIKYTQQWWFQEESKRWLIESEFPDFK